METSPWLCCLLHSWPLALPCLSWASPLDICSLGSPDSAMRKWFYSVTDGYCHVNYSICPQGTEDHFYGNRLPDYHAGLHHIEDCFPPGSDRQSTWCFSCWRGWCSPWQQISEFTCWQRPFTSINSITLYFHKGVIVQMYCSMQRCV